VTQDGVVDVAPVSVAGDRVAPLLAGVALTLPLAGRRLGRGGVAIAGRGVDQRQGASELRHALEALPGDVHANHLGREELRRRPRFLVR